MILEQIVNEKEKKIFLCHNITHEILKDLLSTAIIPVSFIKKGKYGKFTDEIKKAEYLIVVDSDDLNKLDGGKMKALVHGEYSNNKGDRLNSKKLIIICNSSSNSCEFVDAGLRARSKFILFN